jgi:hypothetical protein
MIPLISVVFSLVFVLLAGIALVGVKDAIEEKNYNYVLMMVLLSTVIVWTIGFLIVVGFDLRPAGFEFVDWLAAIYFVIIGLVYIRLNHLVHHAKSKSEVVSNTPQASKAQEEHNHQYWKNYYKD